MCIARDRYTEWKEEPRKFKKRSRTLLEWSNRLTPAIKKTIIMMNQVWLESLYYKTIAVFTVLHKIRIRNDGNIRGPSSLGQKFPRLRF